MKKLLMALSMICFFLLLSSGVFASSVMTFDTVPANTAMSWGDTYTENGITATVYCTTAIIGNPPGIGSGDPTNGLYIGGSGFGSEYNYVVFAMNNGSHFNLTSLDLVTNEPDTRTLTTSNGTMFDLPSYLTLTTIPFSGSNYSDLTSFTSSPRRCNIASLRTG